MERHPTMTVGWMLAMACFDLLFEGIVFGGQLELTIDILAINPQRYRTHRLEPGSTHYFDFFAGACSVSARQ